MPKMKTHRGAAKRFKVTGSGRIQRRKAWRGHNRNKKTAARWRRNQGNADLAPGDDKRIGRMLGR
jgi:large subunit ribosomal protein L35